MYRCDKGYTSGSLRCERLSAFVACGSTVSSRFLASAKDLAKSMISSGGVTAGTRRGSLPTSSTTFNPSLFLNALRAKARTAKTLVPEKVLSVIGKTTFLRSMVFTYTRDLNALANLSAVSPTFFAVIGVLFRSSAYVDSDKTLPVRMRLTSSDRPDQNSSASSSSTDFSNSVMRIFNHIGDCSIRKGCCNKYWLERRDSNAFFLAGEEGLKLTIASGVSQRL